MKLLLSFLLLLSYLYANSQKEILLLHSYNMGLKWTDNITFGVKEILEKHPDYELTVEYMDSKKINTKEYFDSLLNLYEKKFSNRKYEILIAADNYAFNFALNHHKKIFNNIPIVFTGVENFKEDMIPKDLRRYVTGVVEYKEIEKNIKLIENSIHNLDTLYIISDNTLSSKAIQNQIISATKKFENRFNIIYDNKIDITTLSQKVNSLPKNSAVLFTSLYSDIKGRYIPYNNLRTFFQNSKYPIFVLNKIHLGEGVLGGIVVNPIEQGTLATKKAFQIINGALPSSLKIETPTSKYYFDYNIIKKYSLANSNIPILATLINKPKGFFEKYRRFIDSAFLLMPLLILLIIGLIVNIVKRVKLEIKLAEQKKNEQFIIQRSKLSEVGEMMTSIAHQWKAPLIEISTIAQELLYKRSKREFTKEDSQEFVHEIMTQVQYMTKTIDDFRTFIKPSLAKSEFDIKSAMTELLRVVEHNIKYNYISVDLNYEKDKIFTIYGYPNEFKQCILSIINNCRDSILKRKKSENIEGKISIDVYSKEFYTHILIKDNGIGIKDEHLEKIFEPFFTSKKDGDGFGLYMVKLLIEDKMNGKIKAQKSEEGASILISIKNGENI